MSDTEVLAPAGSPPAEQPAPALLETEVTPFEQPVVEAVPAKGGEEEAGAWWREVETEEALHSHESLAPLVEKAKKEGEREAQSRLQPLLQKRRDYARKQTELLETATTNTDAFLERVRAGLRADDPNREEVLDLIQAITPTVKALGGAHKLAAQTEGAKWAVTMLAGDDRVLAGEFLDRVDDIAAEGNESDPNFVQDFTAKLTTAAIEKAVAPKDAEIRKLKASIEKMKAGSRAGEGPNTAPGTGGGGGSYTREQLKNMTPQQIMALDPKKVDEALAGR